MKFWLGGYTADMDGRASGIGMLLAGAADDASAGGALAFAGEVATADSPSWVTPHPGSPTLDRGDVVYAALEARQQVQAFRRTGESAFTPLGTPVDAGEAVCHVAVEPEGRFLVASCWGDGRVVRMDLDAAGRPSSPVVAASAVDPYGPDAAESRAGDLDLAAAARALREAAGAEYAHLVPDHDRDDAEPAAGTEDGAPVSRPSRAHQAAFLPGGLIATTDLGLDLVRFWRDGARGLRLVQEVALPKGSGPRHMVWHPSGHLYVVTELSCELFVVAPAADGTWHLVGGTPLGAGTLPGDSAAELAASRDGEFLYAGVRGSNTMATLRVRGAGEAVAPVALVDAGVDWPRHHLVVRDTLLVAGQRSDEVASLTLDLRTGVPGRVRHRTAAPSPTCIVPVR
ncbi:beta-propeller fold lactonase family protein [Microbacterium sp. M3]|uniref:Beta-propeller fold lactonase family protein n=1 Tax=Microbacterium arthrosphaerae TaxID=792652 RepID=A0ABU4H5B2_9MICO|nr:MULTISPECIES: beta-propeller fold lactonase family protein [Microbacterium]MDW4574538.1 beta-propeller fold lactonase family protein [Microbacterium arthrosphaerae]MDW7608393.1 beta-propeller fold lactonase family protein [Microbacterium sp. M3]